MVIDRHRARNARPPFAALAASVVHGVWTTIVIADAGTFSSTGTVTLLALLVVAALVNSFARVPVSSIANELTFAGAAGTTLALFAPAAVSPWIGAFAAAIGAAFIQAAKSYAWRQRTEAVSVRRFALILLFGIELTLRLQRLCSREIYPHPIIYAEESRFQWIVLTENDGDLRLYLDGALQFSSLDEASYHRALVEPSLARVPYAERVLILGGGDGLAVRELVRHRELRAITVVDLDARVTRLARVHPALVALNEGAFGDPRVRILHRDALNFLEQHDEQWDLIVADLPDPENAKLRRLYEAKMYRLVARKLTKRGLFVTQACSPAAAPKIFEAIEQELSSAGFAIETWRAEVPSFVDTGFIAGRVMDTHVFVDCRRL
jgi:spermidine synthase